MKQPIDSYKIRGFVSPQIWSRGRAYYRQGAVLEVKRVDGGIIAEVAGSRRRPYRVTIMEGFDSIDEIVECTCPYFTDWNEICKHIVATILYIEEMGTTRSMDRRAFTDNFMKSNIIPFPEVGTTRYPSSQHPLFSAQPFFYNWFEPDDAIDVHMDISDKDRPMLEINVVSKKTGRKALLISPPEETPSLIESLRYKPWVTCSDRVKAIKVYKTSLLPYLYADYDEKGRLILTPIYKGNSGKLVFSAEEVEGRRIGNWFWDGSKYRPVDEPYPLLKPYFKGEKPLVYEGERLFEFIRGELKRLLKEARFKPSPEVRGTQVVSPSLDCINVKSEERDWFWLDPVYRAGNLTIPLREIFSFSSGSECIRRGNLWIRMPSEIKQWQRMGGEVSDGRIRLPRLGYVKARAELDRDVKVEADEIVRRFEIEIERVTPPSPAPEPEGYVGILRSYQKYGLDWLWFLHRNGFNGVLADEMGLGKTHQAMALLAIVYHHNKTELPSLIVSPTSVLDHWEDKLREFTPGLKVIRYHGLNRFSLISEIRSHVVLTTYSILSRDIGRLKDIEWEYVILDEAQKIKNIKTKVFRATKLLKAHHRLALTGTPIENRLLELWSIFDFLNPGYLWDNREFKERFEIPIMKYSSRSTEKTLKRIIHPFKLRRLKGDVLKDLPPKIEDTRYCELTPHQVVLYRAIVDKEGMELVAGLRDRKKRVEYMHIFAVLSKLKRICDHPSLVLDGAGRRGLVSGKFELFKELIEEAIGSGEKVVVFSQYLEMMDIIEGWLMKKGLGFASLRGSTRDRRKVIKEFQENPYCRVFVGSLLAGGLGIDLTEASVVIHYDRWWNAARENQATDRVHRIGQKKGVQVFRLITRGTLEEKIDSIIRRKAELMDTIVENDPSGLKSLTREDLIELLTL